MDMGNYDRGFSLLGECLDDLAQSDRLHTPAYITGLLGLLHGSVELQKIDESEKYLKRLGDSLEASQSKDIGNSADRWVRTDMSESHSIEQTFEVFFRARVKELKDDPGAEADYLTALNSARRPEIQRTVVLLYPDVLTCYSGFLIRKGEYDKAEKLASEAVEYYTNKTENRGLDYWKARLAGAYCAFKNGAKNNQEFEEGLKTIRGCVNEFHPETATAHLRLAEVQAITGDFDNARENTNQALRIRRQLFGKDSKSVHEAEKALADLPQD